MVAPASGSLVFSMILTCTSRVSFLMVALNRLGELPFMIGSMNCRVVKPREVKLSVASDSS